MSFSPKDKTILLGTFDSTLNLKSEAELIDNDLSVTLEEKELLTLIAWEEMRPGKAFLTTIGLLLKLPSTTFPLNGTLNVSKLVTITFSPVNDRSSFAPLILSRNRQ